jgi:hypothetical protein
LVEEHVLERATLQRKAKATLQRKGVKPQRQKKPLQIETPLQYFYGTIRF